MPIKLGTQVQSEVPETIKIGEQLWPVPRQKALDYLSRMDEVGIQLIKAVNSLQLITQFVLPKSFTQNPQDLRNALLSGTYRPHEFIGGPNGLLMTTARTDAEFTIEGDTMSWATNGTLEGVAIRFNHKDTDPIPCDLFKDWKEQFFKIYVTHTAQSGKKLYLAVGREAAATGTSQTIYTELKNKVSAVLDSTTTNLGDGATYTGTAFSVEEYGQIMISVYSNRAGTLYVDQSMDGTNYDITESAAYVAAGVPGFYTQVYAPTARIRFANAAGAATTALRIYVRARRV